MTDFPDSERLRLLARWFDMKDGELGLTGAEIQDDLRRIADLLDENDGCCNDYWDCNYHEDRPRPVWVDPAPFWCGLNGCPSCGYTVKKYYAAQERSRQGLPFVLPEDEGRPPAKGSAGCEAYRIDYMANHDSGWKHGVDRGSTGIKD